MRLPFYYGWVIVAVAFLTMALGVNARTAFSLLFPPIIAEFGWERGLTAGAFSFGFFVSALLTPTIGRLTDRFGPLLVIEAGVGMMGLGLLLAPWIAAPWHLYLTLGLLVGGGSVCLGYSGQSLYLPNWFVRRRGLALSIAFSGVGVGSVVVLPVVQIVIEHAGWRTACWTLGLVLVALLAPLNLLLRKSPEDLGLRPDGDAAPVAGSKPPISNVVDAEWAATEWTLRRALRTQRFWWLALGYFCGLYVWYAVQVHQTKYLLEIGFNPLVAAWALGLVSLAGIPGQIALGHVSDHIGREWVWTIGNLGFVLCSVSLILLQRFPNQPLLYAMVLAQGVIGYGVTSVVGAIVAEIFQGKHYGSIFGTVMLAALAGGAAGPWLTGALYDASGSYTPGFAICVAVAALSAVAIWIAAPRKVRLVAGQAAKRQAALPASG